MSDDFDFSNEIDEANWKLIAPHHERGAVFIASDQLDLENVAKVMGRDEVSTVEHWLASGELRKPAEEEVTLWESDSESKKFLFIIIQPYVIIQLKSKILQ